jgi:gamma-glutamyltranspeptidase/glutathione hydrolase
MAFFINSNYKILDMKQIKLLIVILTMVLTACNKNHSYNNNAIATAHPLASEAGNEMYLKGGNAADAAVAAAFTLSVVEPSMSGIGGRLQAIIRLQDNEIRGIDASTQVPENYNKEIKANNYETIGIPGTVAGLLEIHSKYGRLDLKTVMEPAINYAMNGFKILEGESIRQELARIELIKNKQTAKYFLKNDSISYEKGEMFIQKDLAKVLKKISTEGSKGFYEGEIAEKIEEDILANNGFITKEDLKNYEVLNSKILSGNYKGYKIAALYLPSYGAITIEMLQILNHFDLKEKTDYEWIRTISESIKLAYKDRSIQKDTILLKKIVSKDYALEQANKIKKDIIQTKQNSNEPKEWNAPLGHTTHLTTADKSGLVISLTQTIGPLMGSKVAAKDLGFLYAVTMGGYLGDYKPGDRANSHISPTMLFNQNDELILALGAAGGSRIVTAVVQATNRYIDQGKSLTEAISQGRVYSQNDTILIENHQGIKWTKETFQELEKNNIPYKLQKEMGYHGRINAIALDTINNRWISVTDPDWEGKAIDN